MTILSDNYAAYREALLAGGLSAHEADEAVEEMRAGDAKLDALICPLCDSKLTRTLDPRQDGPTEVAGKWFNYRCTGKCSWSTDRCEPVGEN